MQENASNSTTLSMKLPKMIEGNFEPHFSVKHMLKDMQIANRLGLSNHLELGVSSVARDRLLEQMQRGHGDEDYSAVARKYFPDISPTNSEEADLELFEPRAPAAPPPEVAPVPDNDQANNVIQSFPESTEQTLPAEIMPGPFSLGPIEPAESEADLVGHSNAGADSPETTSTPSSEVAEEESQEQRGFFGRLLRRGSNL